MVLALIYLRTIISFFFTMHAFDKPTDRQTDRYRQQELASSIVRCALKIIDTDADLQSLMKL